MRSILDVALDYLAQGIAVIPSNPKTKAPLVKWTEYQSRLPTKEEVISMFRQHPRCMISAITGKISNLVVIDADSQEAVSKIENHLPETFEPIIDISPRGGRHYWFKMNGVEWQSKNSVFEKCDIKANGGVLCVPPSVNDTGGQYRFLNDLEFKRERLQPIPETLVQLLEPARVVSSPKFSVDQKDIRDLFKEGRRDNDLFHVALALRKSGESKEYILAVLSHLTKFWKDNNNPKYLSEKVISAFQYEEKKDRNLAEEIREWIAETHAEFDYKACDFELDLKTKIEKTNRRKIFQRLKEGGQIACVKGKNGWFRKIDNELIYADYAHAKGIYIPLEMPLGISNIVKFSPKGIIIVAGSTNAGKTTFLLNIVKANDYKFFYFNSEMGVNKFKQRLDDFGLPIDFWLKKMKMIERVDNIADLIQPNDINIIDYLETDWEKPWLAGTKIREIFDKLNNGMAIIGLQKRREAPFPRGGEATLEKAQFAVGLDFKSGTETNTAEILKAKEGAKKEFNPNFCACDFAFSDNYTTFHKLTDWRRK